MFNATPGGLCSPRRARFFLIAGVVIACTVANQKAQAEPAAAVSAQAPQAAFTSDRLSVEVV
ncbi:MAG: hypothetical protein RSG56_11115, partial [Brevundimonas sp.]